MIKAIDFVTSRAKARGKPSVISMSISGGFYKTINSVVDSAVDDGIVVVVSSRCLMFLAAVTRRHSEDRCSCMRVHLRKTK